MPRFHAFTESVNQFIQGSLIVLHLVTLCEIYGDDLGTQMYKYFDFHTLIAIALSQILILLFGNRYVLVLGFFAVSNILGYWVLLKIDFRTEDELADQKTNLV